MKKNAFLVFMANLLARHHKQTIDNSVVSELDLQRFLGMWYEVARFDHRFERDMEHTKANYALRADGKIDVLNTGIKNGTLKVAKGKAKLTAEPALLRVSFFGPFYSDYRILLIDPSYQYALIGSAKNKYLWILSRTPELPGNIKSEILSEARRRGYDPNQLIWVKQ